MHTQGKVNQSVHGNVCSYCREAEPWYERTRSGSKGTEASLLVLFVLVLLLAQCQFCPSVAGHLHQYIVSVLHHTNGRNIQTLGLFCRHHQCKMQLHEQLTEQLPVHKTAKQVPVALNLQQ